MQGKLISNHEMQQSRLHRTQQIELNALNAWLLCRELCLDNKIDDDRLEDNSKLFSR